MPTLLTATRKRNKNRMNARMLQTRRHMHLIVVDTQIIRADNATIQVEM